VSRAKLSPFGHLVKARGSAPGPQQGPSPQTPATGAGDAQSIAAAIVAAGAKRRGETATETKPTGLAAKIIAAGKRARGEP
jgi:hypothetical protein